MASRSAKGQLPSPVDQMRFLTWIQFHLSVVAMIAATGAGAILSGQGGAAGHRRWMARDAVVPG